MIHFKGTQGANGVTIVNQHKKKDHKGSRKAQKDTLDRIFAL